VVVWELFQRGAVPYEGKDLQGVREFLDQGNRLPRPEYCPHELYYVMLDCWDEQMDQRPDFDKLKTKIKAILDNCLEQNPATEYTEYEKPTRGISFSGPTPRTSSTAQYEPSSSKITSSTAV
jgi:hypothetical protein